MKIRYDDKIDAMYIILNEKRPYHTSKKITDDVIVDYTKDGQVVGIEILAASENLIMPEQRAVAIEKT